jgi:DegV family protein with EDD domain
MIGIVTDSASDLPGEIVEQYGIEVVPAYINIGMQSLADGVDISRREFYERLPDMKPLPTTASPPPGAFVERYQRLLKRATYVISIHTAGMLSGIVEAARVAARMVEPGCIHIIDSGQTSMGLGWAVKAAAEAAQAGEALEGVLNCVRDTLRRVRVLALLNTVDYLAHSGRVNLIQLGLSNLLTIKPLVELREGAITSVARIRTWSRAISQFKDHVLKLGPLERLAVLHTNRTQHAREILEDLRPLTRPVETMIVDVTSVIGAHTGPQAIGVAAVVAERS